MDSIDITRLSSKGQVVLPQALREQMHLEEGARFMVMGTNDTIILKRLETPSPLQLKQLLKASRIYAKKAGLKQSDIKAVIKKIRARKAA